MAPGWLWTYGAARARLAGVVLFAVTRVFGPSWDTSRSIREQDAWDEHAAFMEALADDGFVVLAGPIADWQRIFAVVEATDEAEVEARLAEDPWTKLGLVEIGAIEPWTIWLERRAVPARLNAP